MWGLDQISPSFVAPGLVGGIVTATFCGVGVAFAASGVLAFRRAQTTVDPIKPYRTTFLVDRGAYRYSRNPMYVGFLLCLLGWGVYLGNVLALLLAITFIPYMNCFQISVEEKALEKIFGAEFETYRARVRRWL